MNIITKAITGIAAAAAVPAIALLGTGTAHADGSPLSIATNPGPVGIGVAWNGGSGETWCNYTSDWFSTRVHQAPSGTGFLWLPKVVPTRSWHVTILCDNADFGATDVSAF